MAAFSSAVNLSVLVDARLLLLMRPIVALRKAGIERDAGGAKILPPRTIASQVIGRKYASINRSIAKGRFEVTRFN